MSNQSATQTYDRIEKLINSSRFNESFLLLKNQLQKFSNSGKHIERLRGLEDTYRYMLDYISEGHSDPSKDELVMQLKDSLHYANDILLREERMVDSSDQYSSLRRIFKLRQTDFHGLLQRFIETYKADQSHDSQGSNIISAAQSELLDEMFNYVWTMFGENVSEYEAIANVLDNDELPEYLKAILISALILGNISYFEPEAFEILLNQYENSQSTIVRARSITGVILLSMLHSQRLAGNISLRSRLLLSKEDEELKRITQEIMVNLLKTYDTKRIDNKMRNEVIPGLMKIKPEIIDKMKNLASDAENFLSDENPRWEELIENSEIGDKLKEINDMQLEGADVMVTAFSTLKAFPFFNKISNWFLPFTPGYFEFEGLPISKDEETASRLTTVMCDSDLHSFLLSLGTMPSDKREMMFKNMESQMKEAKEAMSSAIGETPQQVLSKQIRHTLQDLYRFFKFYKKKNEFKDPFGSPFLVDHIRPLLSVLDISNDNLKVMAEFYFKNKYYPESVGFFEFIDNEEPGDVNNWEKIGYSYDRMQIYDKASEWYLKAELINPGNLWLEKKLAISLKNSGKKKEALEYYNKALTQEPENYHLIMSAAQCYLDAGDPEKALKHLYHAQYLKPDKIDVQRAIAWAELLSKNFDKANSLYEKLLSNPKADKTDFLNAAHAALAGGDFKKALNLYRDFVNRSENRNITALVIALRDDSEAIKQLGIKTSDLRLIVDKIRYDQMG